MPSEEDKLQGTHSSRGSPISPAFSRWTSAILNYLALIARERFCASLSTLQISTKQYAALTIIAMYGPLTQIELGRQLGIDRSTTVLVIDELERLGLAERRRDPRDRRAHALTLTEKGQETLASADKLAAEAEDEFYAPLSSAEREQLHALLQRLVVSLEREPE
ncbi:MarR family transcriptional regulator [Ktedonosporobacter rubrisoli]|uniref:MarR family transcriptional regulator n=1 Tax=Ktedonosporobacter rubrisoli TaxID=2509675 RepID=A0A4P6JIY4_KTERU|nr:MarR family transcriptional regulator [Ktedonosporobacter rubrisoli]QBD75055.1 MarR family transcriptional regulator [Ktedonosporobacter rubrisoli]